MRFIIDLLTFIIWLKKNIKAKLVLIFHNNPLALGGSKSNRERNDLIEKCEKLIFVSSWVKEKFFEGLLRKNHTKCEIIYPSIDRIKKFPNKKRIISFVGKLNRSKGFHLFGSVIVKILNKYKNWKGIIVGDEPREKYSFKHKNLEYKGWVSHRKTLELYNQTSNLPNDPKKDQTLKLVHSKPSQVRYLIHSQKNFSSKWS